MDVEETECSSYAECSRLNAFCAFDSWDPVNGAVFVCKCIAGYDHITGLDPYVAADGNTYTSKCDYLSGEFSRIGCVI